MSQTESTQTANSSPSPDSIFFSSGDQQLRTETPSQVDLSPAAPASILDILETVLTPQEYSLPDEHLQSKKKRNQKPPRSKTRKLDRRREAVRVKAIANSKSLHLRESRRSNGAEESHGGQTSSVVTGGGAVDAEPIICVKCGFVVGDSCKCN
jgi:hypothetical protein